MVQSNPFKNIEKSRVIKCRKQQAAFDEGGYDGYIKAQYDNPCEPDCACNQTYCNEDCDCIWSNCNCVSADCEDD